MDLLLILTYAAVCFGIFKLFRIPVNGFTLLTAALGGAAMISGLILCMNYNHPFTSEARFYYNTTPIVPAVSGLVVDVPVKANTPLKAGDVLFQIDPTPFQNAVKAKEASLAEAMQETSQLQATASSSTKQVDAARATEAGAKDVYDRMQQLVASGSISKAEFEKSKHEYLAAQASSESVEANALRAKLDAEAVINGTNTEVARLQAELETAKFNLDSTTVRAPSNGVVLQMFLRPGAMAASLPLRPVMIFMPDEPPQFAGAFLQNSAQRIEEGEDAEVILPAVPGRVFEAKVTTVGAYIPQGQLQPSGNLVVPEAIQGDGRIIVGVEFVDDLSPYHIVPGSVGNVAVYSHHMHHLAVMRKVLLRMKSWMNFIFSDGH
jgi:multidrug resistance efflux pump